MGIGAGIALGCGLGWPIRATRGPPRAFCGPGIGVGFGFGYGQGIGKRFGRDTRSEEARQRIKAVETFIDTALRKAADALRSFFRMRRAPVPETALLPMMRSSVRSQHAAPVHAVGNTRAKQFRRSSLQFCIARKSVV